MEQSGSEAVGVTALILAAGAGTRMRSELPKPLHEIAGLPMLEHVIRAARGVEPASVAVVASPQIAAAFESQVGAEPVSVVVQDPPLGTGHAVRTAIESGIQSSYILVLYGDHPLVTASVIQGLLDQALKSESRVTLLTCEVSDAAGYGRVERDPDGRVTRIVEAVDDDRASRIGPTEINSGIMVIDGGWAAQALNDLRANERKGEYFLTDLVEIAATEPADRTAVTAVPGDQAVLVGVNDRVDLAAADRLMRDRLRREAMLSGVTLVSPETIMIDVDVTLGQDTVILPFTTLHRGTSVGRACRIGPHSVIERATVGDRAVVEASVVRDAVIEADSHVGPFSHVRAGTSVAAGVHIGNYAEIKQSRIEPGVRIGHFSYVGDATVGAGTNIGAGTVTCNYDGVAKHPTIIGQRAFIGSDSLLVAPLTIGDDAVTGAGSVVTRDVASGSTVVGIPARPIRRSRPTSSDADKGE